ncbi:hydroxypyruvate isomerase [Corynebacterium deserti GIMN1.010]|uniref:Hydroxypyruvate isomerase n=1 Tax=Corynebacterium deserti GIMN1.010 TaxID=931089 RepID=A0A0M4CZE3_9CORY|nr:TIM barrel protein [Corynebacterium deserti]ALC06607.1 hydroxypyruvate isomerase [Corynebacterium deserti GIMN1.010]
MPRFAANLSLTFTELSFLDRFAAAAAYPFEGVEFQFPYEENPEDIKYAADSAGLPIALFNAPPGETKGLAAVETPEDFQRSFQPALDYAAILKPEKMHIMAGVTKDSEENSEENTAHYVSNIRWAADKLQELDVLAVIEPISPRSIPGYFLNDLTQARELTTQISHGNVKILFDIFHIQQIHGDLSRNLRALHADGLLGHIQVASVPHRNEPGYGEVNDKIIFDLIDVLHYPGFVGGEYIPTFTTEEGLHWLESAVSTP